MMSKNLPPKPTKDSDFVGGNRPASQWNLPQFRPAENQSLFQQDEQSNNDGSDRAPILPQHRPAN